MFGGSRFFHADPHGGNLLLRPRQKGSRSPYNFEIVLLDHGPSLLLPSPFAVLRTNFPHHLPGLYFDMPPTLRLNYSHLWLSLLSPSSPSIEASRRHYASLAGNIPADLYPIFQAAITGRVAIETAGKGTLMEMGTMTQQERRKLQNAMGGEGMMELVLELLRRVPRRMLMVLKVKWVVSLYTHYWCCACADLFLCDPPNFQRPHSSSRPLPPHNARRLAHLPNCRAILRPVYLPRLPSFRVVLGVVGIQEMDHRPWTGRGLGRLWR